MLQMLDSVSSLRLPSSLNTNELELLVAFWNIRLLYFAPPPHVTLQSLKGDHSPQPPFTIKTVRYHDLKGSKFLPSVTRIIKHQKDVVCMNERASRITM